MKVFIFILFVLAYVSTAGAHHKRGHQFDFYREYRSIDCRQMDWAIERFEERIFKDKSGLLLLNALEKLYQMKWIQKGVCIEV